METVMGYLWTGAEWVWNPAHGPEGGPSRYSAHKKAVHTTATQKEMQAYKEEQAKPADRIVVRLFHDIRHGGRERQAWNSLIEYLTHE
jgi:hypothetical protein